MIEIALSQYGVKEVPGDEDNPIIVNYFNEIGFDGKALKDETAWCSCFVNWVCLKAGKPRSGRLDARSWLRVGVSTEDPKIGDIVVLWRENPSSWKGHVGFYISENKNEVFVLGGNQANMVCIKAYPKGRLLSYRRL